MLIETRTKEDRLEKGCFTGGPDLIEAAELLYQLLDGSYACSGTCLETRINGEREDIRGLYWKCKDLMEQIQKGGEKTEFLAMSVLEQTFRQAYPLLLVKIEDVAEGDDSQIRAALRLKQLFKENPYRTLWQEKAGKYQALVEKMGFRTGDVDYSDLTAIMDPLLDAFTLYQGRNHCYPPEIHKVRTGARSRKSPEVGGSICKYSSEKELVDAVAGCGKEAVIVFGAVEKTNRQVRDGFHEWYYGYADERQRNFMLHDHITAEEYLDQVCDYSRCVYLCVKSGDTIWLMRMPYQRDNYSQFEDPKSKYYYGRRAGYAPYEIFYKEPPAAESDTTFLSVPRRGYLLSELMDEQQKIWFPIFIEETIERFFRAEQEPETDGWVLPEETEAVIPGCSGSGERHIIPVYANLPAVPQYTYQIREPKEMFEEGHMQELLEYFKVSREDIADVPVLPTGCGTREDCEKKIGEKVKKAYSRILAGRIADFLEGKWVVRRMILDRITADKGRIIEDAAEGRFASFMSVIVDGTQALDKNGNPAMQKKYSWSTEMVPVIIHTTSDECTESQRIRHNTEPKILWVGNIPSGKASVVWKLRPKRAEDYAQLLGMPEKELPDILRMSDAIDWFYKEYGGGLPTSLTNEYTCGDYEGRESYSIYLPPLGNVNICMTKKTYKKYTAKQRQG